MASLPEHVVPPGMKRIEQHRQSASDGAIHEVGAPGDDVVAPKHEARDEDIGKLYTKINFLEKKVKILEREKQDEASKHEKETKEFNAIILAEEKKLKEGTIHYQTEIDELLSKILEMGRELEEKKSELEEAVNRCQTDLLLNAQEAKANQDDALTERDVELNTLKEKFKQLMEQNEKLQEEKEDVQVKLAQINGKLQRYQNNEEQQGLSDESLTGNNSAGERSKVSPKLRFSTPLARHSICMELKDRQLENNELEKKSATNRKEDLRKLMVQTTRLFEEKEKLKQEKANLVEILKMQTEVQQRKILQLESQLEPGTVAVSACIEMGYSHENVMRASQIFHERQGCTAEHLMRILMKMEEEEELQGAVGGGQG